jgi:hypothetical protein
VKDKLAQLLKKGMWKLVEKPADTVPITNKWVFTKKYSKNGDLLKYKAQLVVKGCAQRPAHNYDKTFAPVVRLEMVRAILALAINKDLVICQMDVKGAYLNRVLKETVYMQQPEGYKDNTGRTCLLVKTLYSLKQAGWEWNRELDKKLHKHNFRHLCSDPCTYVHGAIGDYKIITIWVDDLLLFALSIQLCRRMKKDLCLEWEITDLGEPAKIISIEITQEKDAITISQQQYIENILLHKGMDHVNPVAMPLDLNIQLEPNPDGNEGSRSNSYIKLLGEL